MFFSLGAVRLVLHFSFRENQKYNHIPKFRCGGGGRMTILGNKSTLKMTSFQEVAKMNCPKCNARIQRGSYFRE